jgi:ribose transport system ATP-binding protein
MTGRNIEYVFPPRPAPAVREPILVVTGLTRTGEFADVELSVAPGEIVGIAGLVGSGRSELLETIYGGRRPDAGAITLDGRRIRSTEGAVKGGMGMAPEERKSQALLLDQPVFKNMTLASFSGFARAGFTDAGGEREAAQRTADRLDLRPRDVSRPVRTLSGGNQQKVVVGRWLLGRDGERGAGRAQDRAQDRAQAPAPAQGQGQGQGQGRGRGGTRLLLLDEPTRGVDVGARAELYQVIRALAEDGVGVLLVSSEVPEVLGLADRVLVMREGRIVHEAPATELDEDTVLDLVMAGSLLEGELKRVGETA